MSGERLIHHGRADVVTVSFFLGAPDARQEAAGVAVLLVEKDAGLYELTHPFGGVLADARAVRVILPDGRAYGGEIQWRRFGVLAFAGGEVT